MWRWTARFGVAAAGAGVLTLGTAAGASAPVYARASAPAFAQASARGVLVEIVEIPDRFVAGAAPETITVVATRPGGGDCLKVRWSMVLRVEGLTVEQVRVDRIEENGSFPVDAENDGTVVRVTDEQLDPGTLCRNRTVTARYRLNVANDVRGGQLTVVTEAYDTGARLLERDSATRQVVGAAAPPRSTARPPVNPEPDTSAADTTPEAEAGAGGGAPASGADAAAGRSAAGTDQNGIPLAWFLIGALMMFLGLSLLFNVRRRQRSSDGNEQIPTARISRYRTVPRRARGW